MINTNNIKIENLTVTIKDKVLLKNINVEIKENRTLTIIGESGSGKTLIAKLLVGKKIEKMNVVGEIMYKGENLLEISELAWRKYRGKNISYVAQNPMSYFNPMDKIKNFAYEIFKSHIQINKRESDKLLLESLFELNLEDAQNIIEKYPFQLSGGMLQRIMFAIIMSLRPEIMIVDEPTSSLDSKNTKNVIYILQKLKKQGITLIIITHDYKLLKALADDILILKHGEIIEQGNLSYIIENAEEEYTRELLSPRNYVRKQF